MGKIRNPKELQSYRDGLLAKRRDSKKVIAVCCGTGCNASGAKKVAQAFVDEVKKAGLEKEIDVRPTGCHGFCERGTLVLLHPEATLYTRVKPEDVSAIVEKTVKAGEVLEKHLYDDPVSGERHAKEHEIPFYKHQERLILGKNGLIDPTKIDDYIALGGYQALAKALEMGPERVLDEVKRANVRGRGGGGFPAGRKWETCRNAQADKRYVICNADEGDPGAFMDRSVLEGNPHAVIEGMLIGAFTVGSDEGYVYVRHEYPLAVQHLTIALEQAREKGLLGAGILGTGFSFDVKINRGGGAFVCGESTALMASIEGKVGEPRAKHIHTVVAGLNGKPTNLNNVETWANIPLVIEKGADWYTKIGTQGSPGTKIFSLVGKVNNTGLVEVPMGMTLRKIIFDIGGGIPKGGAFKAVQTGHPGGLRHAGGRGLDDGLRRHDRHGRQDVHGRRRQVLPQLPQVRVVREVHDVPRGDAAAARAGDGHHRGARHEGDDRAHRGARGDGQGGLAVRARDDGGEPGAVDAEVLPGRVPRARRREALPGGGVQVAHHLRDHRRVHRLRGVQEAVPGERDLGREETEARDRHEQVHQVRHLQGRLQVRRRARVLRRRAA
jgi:NADH:ubiquinone oxidoreductase subunit F (NADH-binding)/(2Fe-2S) ferredoxin